VQHHRADFTGLPASEFPALPSVSTTKSLLPTSLLIGWLKSCFAAASDDSRPVLTEFFYARSRRFSSGGD
jgi:DNA polymerase III sliding clamp (beta) subunit (PCNA family)